MRINCKKTFLVGAVAAGLAATQSQAGLTHRYNFNSDAKDSVGTAHATLNNNASTANQTGYSAAWPAGNLGVFLNNASLPASSATTGDYVTIPGSVLSGIKNQLSLEFWTDLGDSSISAGSWSRVFDWGNPFNSTGGYNGSGKDYIMYTPHSGQTPANAHVEINVQGGGVTTGDTTPIEGYHHVVCSFDSSNNLMQVFVDGVKTGSRDMGGKQVTNISTAALWLGRSEYSGDQYMYGAIDEFRVYDRALSGVEAAGNFIAGANIYTTNSVTNLPAITALNMTDPGPITETYSSNTVITADFGATTGVSVFNAPGFTLANSAPTIATVDNAGVIKALKPGTTTVTATYRGQTKQLVITVVADTAAPTIVKADTLLYDRLVQVTFSKAVDPVTATNLANYSIDQGVTITSATFDTNAPTKVSLFTSKFDVNSGYILSVSGIKDIVTTPNTMVPATVPFGSAPGAALIRRIYRTADGFKSGSLADGKTNPGYPYSGGITVSLPNGLTDDPGGHGDNYFTVISGWIVPAQSGTYSFGAASDDEAAIYVSTTDKEADLPLSPTLAQSGWRPTKDYHNGNGTDSGPNSVTLNAGQKYFFRAINRNGTGGDNFDITWNTGGASAILAQDPAIPASVLQPIYPTPRVMTITTQPTDVFIGQNQDAIFTVAVDSMPAYTSVQWYRNGVAIATNGTSLKYTLPIVKTNDSGSVFYAVVKNLVDTVESTHVTLTVSSDDIKPQLLAASAVTAVGPLATNVFVTFNERVDTATAQANSSYTITGTPAGVTVTKAVLDANTKSNVVLTVSPLVEGQAYTLTVKNVKDLSANVIDPAHNSITFHAAQYVTPGVFNIKIYDNYTAGSDAIITAAPSLTVNRTLVFNQMGTTGTEYGDNFAGIAEGVLVAPETGDYYFHMSSDDGSRLFLSTDATAANLSGEIAGIDGWSDGLTSWGTDHGGNAAAHPNKSAAITLTAGQRYYYRVSWAEGGGGDYVSVGWELPSKPGTIVVVPGSALASLASADLSSLTITNDPASVTKTEGQRATFTVVAGGTDQYGGNIGYQWYKNDVAIPGATGASYTTPLLMTSDSGSVYKVACSVLLLSKTSAPATLTVVPTTIPFSVVSAGAFPDSTTVGVRFNRYADPTGVSADKFTVPGYTVQSVTYLTNANVDSIHGDAVALTLDQPVTTDLQVIAKGIVDMFGHAGSSTNVIDIVDTMQLDVGTTDADGVLNNPAIPGNAIATGKDSYRIVAGGSDIWDSADHFHYVYKEVTGDFDAKLRVANLHMGNTWSKSGLIFRTSTNADAAGVYQMVTPTAGQNTWAAGLRAANNTGYGDFPLLVAARVPNPSYPNAWVRITREGDDIRVYSSTDGKTWQTDGDDVLAAGTFPTTLVIGIGVTSHDNGTNTWLGTVTDVYDFSVGPYIPPVLNPPTLGAIIAGNQVTLSWATADSTGFKLVESDDLKTWTDSTLTVTDNGTTSSVTITPTAKKFYQLMKP